MNPCSGTVATISRARLTYPWFSSAEIPKEGTGGGGVRANDEHARKSVSKECLRAVDETLFGPAMEASLSGSGKDLGVCLEHATGTLCRRTANVDRKEAS